MKHRFSLWVVFAITVLFLGSEPLCPAEASEGAVLVVNSAADAGPGTLREALALASPGTTITFDPAVFPLDRPATIALRSPLPTLAQGGVTIDASAAGIVLDGGALDSGCGLTIASGLNQVKGLHILHFPAFGILLEGAASDNLIGGRNATPDSGCSGDCNVISGNHADGLHIRGPHAANNRIVGNFIGTDPTGREPIGNGARGVTIDGGAKHNHVGGVSAGERNLISGNGDDGVAISDPGTMSNTVSGNYIGTDVSGTTAVPNGNFGVNLADHATENRVGGTSAAERNIISGNIHGGVNIAGPGVMYNVLTGNFVGTDATGSIAIPNLGHGVTFGDSAQRNRLGGPTPSERNVISGNGKDGVTIESPGTKENNLLGNYIGTDASGTCALDNESGVHIRGGATGNVVGGDRGEGNVISGNRQHGLVIEGQGVTGNICTANLVGVTADGSQPLPNALDGVLVAEGAQGNMIGPGNTIAYNGRDGVRVQGPDTKGIRVTANSVYANNGQGIQNVEGGNIELDAPEISYLDGRQMRGQAPPNATVEVFSDTGEQGRFLEGSATTDVQGRFSFVLPSGRFSGPRLTAVALDPTGNTSPFSTAASPPAPRLMRELPAIIAPTQVSVEPAVVGTNLALALFCVLFFGFTSTVFNEILEHYRDELLASVTRFVPRPFARVLTGLGAGLQGLAAQGRGRLLAAWFLVLAVTALLQSLLDTEVPILGGEWMGLWATLFLSAAAVSGLELSADLYMRRRLAPTASVHSKIQWLGIPIALGCVILSRALDFKPGYLFGIVGALYLIPDLSGPKAGRRALVVLLTLFAAGVVLWLATPWLPATLVDLEPLFLTMFLITLQGIFFALLPLSVTEGGHIWNWRKGLWLVFFVAVLFLFHHVVLNPDASDVQALQQNGVQTLWLLIGVFGLGTLLLWLLFPFRLRHERASTA